jgi:hypothetical protein
MLFFKDGVSIKGLGVEALLGIMLVEQILTLKGKTTTVTSCLDGKHMEGSLHYKGQAFDLRTWVIETEDIDMIKGVLGRLGFDVVLEADHLHIEFDPK